MIRWEEANGDIGYAIEPAAYAAEPVRCDELLPCSLPFIAAPSTHPSLSCDHIAQALHTLRKLCILTTNNSVNKEIAVRLKWGQTEYRGILVSIDSYMNIQLTNTQEYIDQKMTATLGQVLIRCNNVLWIQGVPLDGKKEEEDTTMEG